MGSPASARSGAPPGSGETADQGARFGTAAPWDPAGRSITVVYLDGDVATTSTRLAPLVRQRWTADVVTPQLAGPFRSPVAYEAWPAEKLTTLVAVRVGLVCPYSLTIPGGVQGQVLGLARSLRGLGHEVRVLGPCDGPPPDAGVTPLGRSVPTAANGSVAPLAPDPSAQLRTIRALRDEDFEVLHLHEPMAPGTDW